MDENKKVIGDVKKELAAYNERRL